MKLFGKVSKYEPNNFGNIVLSSVRRSTQVAEEGWIPNLKIRSLLFSEI